jgi:hypothetical protein
VAKPVLYTILRALQQRGEIVSEPLSGGAAGYRLAPERPAEPVPAEPTSPSPGG